MKADSLLCHCAPCRPVSTPLCHWQLGTASHQHEQHHGRCWQCECRPTDPHCCSLLGAPLSRHTMECCPVHTAPRQTASVGPSIHGRIVRCLSSDSLKVCCPVLLADCHAARSAVHSSTAARPPTGIRQHDPDPEPTGRLVLTRKAASRRTVSGQYMVTLQQPPPKFSTCRPSRQSQQNISQNLVKHLCRVSMNLKDIAIGTSGSASGRSGVTVGTRCCTAHVPPAKLQAYKTRQC
jgi:hypothetical protein